MEFEKSAALSSPSLVTVEELMAECQGISSELLGRTQDRVDRILGCRPEKAYDETIAPAGVYGQLQYLRGTLMKISELINRL